MEQKSRKSMRIVLAAAAVIAVAVVILLVPWYRGYMKQINFRTCMRARRKVCIDVREMKKVWREEAQSAAESGEEALSEGNKEAPSESSKEALPDRDTQIEFFLQAVENLPTEVSEPKLESEEDGILKFTCTGLCKEGGITAFDDYANWMNDADTKFGTKVVLGDRTEYKEPQEIQPFVDEVKQMVADNINQNVVELAKANPEVEFYYYITPYSIAWWGSQKELGTVDRFISAEEYAISLMLECDNIHLYSFNTEFDMICDLDNYSDECHHGDWINSQILGWLYSGTDELTKDNYKEYIQMERDFYNSYDYESLLGSN